jgi:hypothetical protein
LPYGRKFLRALRAFVVHLAGSMADELATLVTDIARRARAASLVLAIAPTAAKNAALMRLADLLPASKDALLAANAQDQAAAQANNLTSAQIDRLTLTPDRIAKIAEGVRQVAALPDPVGEELDRTVRPNGLEIRRLRVPIGVIGIIYEARPNVTIDCAALCLKSGNAAILRGGTESFHTNQALVDLIHQAIADTPLSTLDLRLSASAVQLIPTTDRAQARFADSLPHPPWWRKPYPLCDREFHHSRHQAFQRRVFCLRRPGRRSWHGREDRRQCEGAAPGSLQRRRAAPGPRGCGGLAPAPPRPRADRGES